MQATRINSRHLDISFVHNDLAKIGPVLRLFFGDEVQRFGCRVIEGGYLVGAQEGEFELSDWFCAKATGVDEVARLVGLWLGVLTEAEKVRLAQPSHRCDLIGCRPWGYRVSREQMNGRPILRFTPAYV